MEQRKLSRLAEAVGLVMMIGFLSLLVVVYNSKYGSLSLTTMFSNGGSCSAPNADTLLGLYGALAEEAVDIGVPTTKSESARTLFRQGVMQMWNFNTPEALRNLQASVDEDRDGCALCHWGLAAARGTNINRFVEESDVEAGLEALGEARRMIDQHPQGTFSKFEEMLIDLQTARWPKEGVEEWKEKGQDYFDEAYSEKLSSALSNLSGITQQQSGFLRAIYAESVMTCHRWDYYRAQANLTTSAGGVIKNLRAEIMPAYEALKQILSEIPSHPLALHLWIHLTEQSNNPAEGEEAADRLSTQQKRSKFGHLAHMPAHTYLRMGAYSKAIVSSIASIGIDREYEHMCLEPYCAHHNIAVLIHSAMHSARKELAVDWAPNHSAEQADHVSAQYISGLFLTPLEFVYSKFGDWEQLTKLSGGAPDSITVSAQAALDRELSSSSGDGDTDTSSPPPSPAAAAAVREVPAYLRTIAAYGDSLATTHLATASSREGDAAAAKLQKLEAIAGQIRSDEEAFYIPRNHVFYPFHKETGKLMVSIARAALEVKRGKVESAVTTLRAGVTLQDSFQYMEPEHFYTPLRHCLGAALLLRADEVVDASAGHDADAGVGLVREAVGVYLRDLEEHPSSVWALVGLRESYDRLERMGNQEHRKQEAAQALQAASADAERIPNMSCCELGAC